MKASPSDMLRFLGGPIDQHEVGWTGPWPPPERMALAVGGESGIVKVFDPAEIDAAALHSARALPSISVCVYRLRNASQLPDDFDSKYVFRGAEYVPEEG